jgi:hypothetical protein
MHTSTSSQQRQWILTIIMIGIMILIVPSSHHTTSYGVYADIIDDCIEKQYCSVNGTCINSTTIPDSYECQCDIGFAGVSCDGEYPPHTYLIFANTLSSYQATYLV